MDRSEANYKRMTETNVSKLILLLGLPTTISMLVTNIYNLADTYFVGLISIEAQAATSVLFTLQSIIQAVAFTLGIGAGTYVSKYLADKDEKTASKYVTSSFYLGILLAIILLIFGMIFLTPFMRLLGASDTALPDAKEYGMWVLISSPFMVGAFVLNNNLRFEGKAFYAMFGLVSGGLLNILGDYIFVVLLDMGIRGAGLSTAISQIISFIILVTLYIIFCQTKLHPKYISKNFKTYFQIIRAGFPSFIRQGITAISTGVLNNLCINYTDSATAAMGIVNRYSNFILCIGIGIGQGFQPVCAFNYQAKKYKRVKKGFLFTIIFSTIVISIVSLIGMFIPRQLIYLFNQNESVINMGENALRFMLIGILFIPLVLASNMLYQSIRKSEIASVLAMLRSGIIFIPLILMLESTIGFTGIEIAQPISDVFAGLFSIPFIIYFMVKTPNEEGDSNGI